MRKDRLTLVISVLMAVLAVSVSAANYGSSMQNALKPLLDLFGGLVGLIKDPFYSIILMRFILWIIAFNLFLLAVRKTPFWGDNPTVQKNAKMIAVFLALGGILVIPSATVQGLFFYIGILIIVGLVVVIINMVRGFSSGSGGSVAGGLIGIGIAVALLIADFTLFGSAPYNTQKVFFDLTLFDLMMMAALIILITGLITLIGGAGGEGGGHGSSHGANQDVDVDVDGETEDPVKVLAADIKNVNGEIKGLDTLITSMEHLETVIPRVAIVPPGSPFHNTALGMRDQINARLATINNELLKIMGDSNYAKLSKKNKTQFDKMWDNYLGLVIDYSDVINKLNSLPRDMGL